MHFIEEMSHTSIYQRYKSACNNASFLSRVLHSRLKNSSVPLKDRDGNGAHSVTHEAEGRAQNVGAKFMLCRSHQWTVFFPQSMTWHRTEQIICFSVRNHYSSIGQPEVCLENSQSKRAEKPGPPISYLSLLITDKDLTAFPIREVASLSLPISLWLRLVQRPRTGWLLPCGADLWFWGSIWQLTYRAWEFFCLF